MSSPPPPPPPPEYWHSLCAWLPCVKLHSELKLLHAIRETPAWKYSPCTSTIVINIIIAKHTSQNRTSLMATIINSPRRSSPPTMIAAIAQIGRARLAPPLHTALIERIRIYIKQ